MTNVDIKLFSGDILSLEVEDAFYEYKDNKEYDVEDYLKRKVRNDFFPDHPLCSLKVLRNKDDYYLLIKEGLDIGYLPRRKFVIVDLEGRMYEMCEVLCFSNDGNASILFSAYFKKFEKNNQEFKDEFFIHMDEIEIIDECERDGKKFLEVIEEPEYGMTLKELVKYHLPKHIHHLFTFLKS